MGDPDPGAAYVEVGSGNFVAVLVITELGDHVLLADRMNDASLTAARGGPWRLVGVGGRCYQR